jgi:hypothetical protein
MKKNEEVRSKVIQDVLDEIPEVMYKQVRIKMMIAAMLDDYMKEHNLVVKSLCKILEKRESFVRRWLSGGYNFTIDDILCIHDKLGLDMFSMISKEKYMSRNLKIEMNKK